MLGKNVAQGHEFIFCNNEKAHNLDEFKKIVENLEENEFQHHVNDERNDFANWITWALGNETLGNEVNELKTKEEIIESLNNAIQKKKQDKIKEKTEDNEQKQKEELIKEKDNSEKEIKPEIKNKPAKVIKNLINKEKEKTKAKEFLIIEFVIGLIAGLVIGIILGIFVF
ncbi:hypothetical protein JW949_04440 [Candidatus Woesearchaeota archaeon]|nr:hypothetical protein [Candidatus Woesearchaeota archaeon]